MKELWIYGLADAANKYRIVRYEPIDLNDFSVAYVTERAVMLKYKNPTIEHVYIVDNRGGLGYDVARTMKKNTIAGNVAFKDMCERNGWCII